MDATDNKPIYCRECRGLDTWERKPEGDIKTPDGKVYWERWRCQGCGHETIYPGEGLKVKQGD